MCFFLPAIFLFNLLEFILSHNPVYVYHEVPQKTQKYVLNNSNFSGKTRISFRPVHALGLPAGRHEPRMTFEEETCEISL